VFTITAIATMPARIAYRLFSPANAPIQLQHIKGTIWSGQAEKLVTMKHEFSKLQWQIHPMSLLMGDISLDVQIKDPDYPVQTSVIRGFGSGIQLDNLRAVLPASIIQQIPAASFLSIDGTLNMKITRLTADDNGLSSAEGEIRLDDSKLTSPIQGVLGTLRFQLSNKQDDILVKITDQQAPIGVDGSLRLKPQKKFSLRASLTPRANADAFLVTMLKNAARPQQDGSLLIQYNGVY